jgi:8-oxo-dGTP pyrophosphatase MutT (NUDIX family)
MNGNIVRYLELFGTLPEPYNRIGDLTKGEMQIETDPEKIAQIEADWMAKLAAQGKDPAGGRVGVVHEDGAMYFINDPIWIPNPDGQAPTGRTWGRVIWKNGITGKSVVLVPVTEDGLVVLVEEYRHVSRRWEASFPGGGDAKAKTYEQVVRAEALEEMGYEVKDIRPLGDDDFFVDSSTNGTAIRTYGIRLGAFKGKRPEPGELIGKNLFVKPEDLDAGFRRGCIDDRNGRRLHLLSGRNGHAYLMAKLYGLA